MTDATQASGQKQLRQLDRLHKRQVRLVVALPALMFLFSLLLALIIRLRLLEGAEEVASETLRKQLDQMADAVMWLGLFGAIAIGLAGIALAYQIVRPVRRIISTMHNVARGDLSSKMVVTDFGELGILSTTFNQMVEHLNELFDQRDRQMRDSAAGAVITLDRNGRVLAADASARHILGIDYEVLLGCEIAAGLAGLLGTENRRFIDALKRGLHEIHQGRTGIASEEYVNPATGATCFYSIHMTLLESVDEASPTVLLDIRDLTGMRAFHDQMQRADRLAALGTLAAGIAHEIRNPLASMRAMTQLLAEDLAPENREAGTIGSEYMTRVIGEIDRLERLVASIMDFANAQEGPVSPVDLNEALRTAYDTSRHRLAPEDQERIRVQWNLDCSLPLCPLQSQLIQQALINLITNALDALKEDGGGDLRFESFMEAGSDRPLVLRIGNSGDPIPSEIRSRLFEPFYTTKPEGSGLGLPIAYQIIVANGGLIDLDCRDGLIEFSVRFPAEGRHARLSRGVSAHSLHRNTIHPTPSP